MAYGVHSSALKAWACGLRQSWIPAAFKASCCHRRLLLLRHKLHHIEISLVLEVKTLLHWQWTDVPSLFNLMLSLKVLLNHGFMIIPYILILLIIFQTSFMHSFLKLE